MSARLAALLRDTHGQAAVVWAEASAADMPRAAAAQWALWLRDDDAPAGDALLHWLQRESERRDPVRRAWAQTILEMMQ